jgi:DNA processing protein
MTQLVDLRDFSENLERAEERQDLLWCDGDSRLLRMPLASVVGTRDISPEGERRTRKLTGILVNEGFCVVSGLAKGVDRVAHETALNMNGHTIAVMGTPINQCYPLEHQELKEQIARHGLILSQFPPGTPIQRSNFPQRNVLMAKLSMTTFVVEAHLDSGTKHQVRAAVRMGKKVGFLASLVDKDYPWVREALDAGFGVIIEHVEDAVSFLQELRHETPADVPSEIPKASRQDEFVFLIETEHRLEVPVVAESNIETKDSRQLTPIVAPASATGGPGVIQRIWRLISRSEA